MAFIKMVMQADKSDTPVPNTFIDYYMSCANPIFVVVYLLAFRHCVDGTGISTKDIAAKLGILESDVLKAWQYWQEKGLIHLSQDEEEEICIAFLEVPVPQKEKETAKQTEEPVETKKVERPLISLNKRPVYSTQELEIYKENSDEIRDLFQAAEAALARPLEYSDLNVLFSLYDWLRLPLPVVTFLLEYCAAAEHRDMRYIEKVALNWAQNNIQSVAEAEEFIQNHHKDYRAIFKACGFTGRNPVAKEMEYMKQWLEEWGMPLELVLEACDRTVMTIGKPRFTYIHKILKDWYEHGVTKVEDISKLDMAYHEGQETKKTIQPEKSKKSRFVNFSQRKVDRSELEQMERMYIEKMVKGN